MNASDYVTFRYVANLSRDWFSGFMVTLPPEAVARNVSSAEPCGLVQSSSFFPEVRRSDTLIGLLFTSGRRRRRGLSLRGENRRLPLAKIRGQNRDSGDEEPPGKFGPFVHTDLPARL